MASGSSMSQNELDPPVSSAGQPSGAKYQQVQVGDDSINQFGDSIGVQNVYFSQPGNQEQQNDAKREEKRVKIIQQLKEAVCDRLPPVPRPSRQTATRRWALENKRFKRWLEHDNDTILWVTGSPGSGKSVLSRSLVETELRKLGYDNSATILYFFFSSTSEDTRKASIAMRALLQQKLRRNRPLADLVDSSANLQDLHTLWQTFTKVIGSVTAGNSICIIDGLDECEDITEFLDGLTDSMKDRGPESLRGYCKFFLASRPHESIGFAIEEASQATLILRIDCTEEKIRDEVEEVVLSDIEDLRLQPRAKERLRELVLGARPLRYLWWRTVLQRVKTTAHRNSLHILDAIVKEIPTDLSRMYRHHIGSIPAWEIPAVRRLLGAILASREPLHVEALAELHALHPDTQRFEDLEIAQDFSQKLPAICGFLIVVENRRASFFHDTAREFLLNGHAAEEANMGLSFTMESAHQTALDASLDCLLLQDIRNLQEIKTLRPQINPGGFWDNQLRLRIPPYLSIAGKPCCLLPEILQDFTYHLRLCRQSVLMSATRVKCLLDFSESAVSRHLFRHPFSRYNTYRALASYESPLSRMYALDLHGLVPSETYAREANSQDDWGFTALHNAAGAGDPVEVRKLLALGANPAVEASKYNEWTPLELCFWGTKRANLDDLEQRRDAADALVMKALHATRSRPYNLIRSAFYWTLCHRFGNQHIYSDIICNPTTELMLHLEKERRAETMQRKAPPQANAPPTITSVYWHPGSEAASDIRELRKAVEGFPFNPIRTRAEYGVILYFLLCADGEPTVYWIVVLWEVVRFHRKDIIMLKVNRRTWSKMRQATQKAVVGVVEVLYAITAEFVGFRSPDAENGNLSSLMSLRKNIAAHLDELVSIKTAFKKQLAESYPGREHSCSFFCYNRLKIPSDHCDFGYFKQISYFTWDDEPSDFI